MEEKITLFMVEVGVLLAKNSSEFEDYSQVFDCKHAYYDENTCIFLDGSAAIEFALNYVMKGVNRTYAIVKELSVSKEWVDDTAINDIKNCGIFDGWDDVLGDERFDAKHIVLDLYKSGKETLKYNFVEKEHPYYVLN